jgi:hypothetical protein
MTSSEKRLNGWMTVAAIFFCLQVIVGLVNLLLADTDATPAYWLFFLFAAFPGAGVILALNGHYSAARVLLWIGGILSFPLGLILIRAGNRIKQSAPPTR